MKYEDISVTLNDISYKDWTLKLNRNPLYLQWVFYFEGVTQHGRKWLLSNHMTKSEIVLTALKAAITAEEHEARESFRYKGKKIFGPHFDVDVLVEIAGQKKNLDIRQPIEV